MPLDEHIALDPMPTETGDLFTTGADWQSRACLNFVEDQWDLYAIGFKNAADVLVDRLKENNVHLDSLVYPICFLFRQYLELRLKEILKEGWKLLERDEKVPATHNIVLLWKKVKEIVVEIFPGDENSTLAVVDCVIDQFYVIDASSFSFRYPVDKENNPSLPGKRYINVVDLKVEIDKSGSILEGISAAISVCKDNKKDMESNYSI